MLAFIYWSKKAERLHASLSEVSGNLSQISQASIVNVLSLYVQWRSILIFCFSRKTHSFCHQFFFSSNKKNQLSNSYGISMCWIFPVVFSSIPVNLSQPWILSSRKNDHVPLSIVGLSNFSRHKTFVFKCIFFPSLSCSYNCSGCAWIFIRK